MSVKRWCQIYTDCGLRAIGDGEDRIDGDEEYVLASDYDSLAAELADTKAHIESLQNRWASRPLSNPDMVAYIAELETALRSAANFIGRWSAVFNAQERSVMTNEFRAAERAARAHLPASETSGELKS